MSKIYDVEKMYGQDFSIVTTNAPSNIIKQAKKLLPNILLISSPQNSEGEDSDNNLPAMFITDYNAQPLQLTYSFYMKNGLNYSEENSYAFINIDNSTITTENADGSGKLKVETDNLKSASFSNKGVVKLSTISTDIDRNLSENYQLTDSVSNKFNQSTFISVNDEGILYINNDLLSLINNIVDLKIKQKIDSIKIMLNNNLKMWIVINYINGLDVSSDGKIFTLGAYDAIKLNDLGTVNNTGAISLTFDLYYYSFNNESENVNIIDETNKIYDISFSDEGTQTKVSPVQDNDELYQHQINNITLTFLPNYFIENNESYNQDYQLLFEVDDKKDTLLFRQNKLSNFNSDNFKITLETSKLAVNAVLNKSLKTRLIEKITNNNVLRSIKSNESDNSLVRFVIDTFIIHPDAQFKNIDNYLQYNLIKGYEYIPNETELNIFLDNIDDSGKQTKLYDFITNIISDTSLESDGENYTIEFDGDLLDNSGQSINDYVKREIISLSEINYYIGIGVKFSIISSKNVNLGTYSVILPVLLDMNKSAKYGYLYISLTNGNGESSNTPYIYYNNRSGEGRIMVSHIDEGYTGANIDTTQLFCIFDSDLSLSNGQEDSTDTELSINYTDFKEFNANEDNPNNNNVTISKENVSFDSELISFDPGNNNKILVSLSAPGSTNVIHEMAENIYTLLSGNDEFTFTIDFNKNDKGKGNIIRSQEVKMNVNLLHIMLSNISISKDSSNWINLGDQIRWDNNNTGENNYRSTNTYQQMNNYVIQNTIIDNNNIQAIKIKIPNYIIIALKKGIQFNIVLSCYRGNNIENAIISLNRDNNTIRAQIDQNLYTSDHDILSFSQVSQDQNNNERLDHFGIKYSESSTHYIQLSVNTIDGINKLPKLLMISFYFNTNKTNNKISYIEDTVTSGSASNGTIKHENNPYVIKSNVDTKALYDIIYINPGIDDATADNNLLKDVLIAEDSSISNNYKVKVSKLSVGQLNYTFTQDLNDDLTSKFCLVSKTDDGESNYSQVYRGQKIENIKYKFQYLTNQNGVLDNYNLFCKNTPINGATQYVDAPYDLRFTKIYMKPIDLTNQPYYIYNIPSNSNNLKLYKFSLKTNNEQLDPTISFSDFTGIFNKLFVSYINDSNNNIVAVNDITLMDSNNSNNIINSSNPNIDWIQDGYKICLNKTSVYSNIDIQNLDTRYKINILSFDWLGFKNGNDPAIELTQNSVDLIITIKINTSSIINSNNDENEKGNQIRAILSKFVQNDEYSYTPNNITVNAKTTNDTYRDIELNCGTGTDGENIGSNTLFFQENGQSNQISFIKYLKSLLNNTSFTSSNTTSDDLQLYINLFGNDGNDPIYHSTLMTRYKVKFESDTSMIYTITFMNDENPIGNGVRGKEGDLITPPTISDYDAPSGKDGYIFGGWSNTPDGTDDFRNEDGKIMINHSIQTYYAIWNAPQQPDPETPGDGPEGGE